MNLRTQMLLAGALTLVVPVIGWQSVKQLDATLRQTRIDEQSLRVANARLALAESADLQPVLMQSLAPEQSNDVYAEYSRFPLFVDGYDDDWRELHASLRYFPARTASTRRGFNAVADKSFSIRLAEREQRLSLFLDIRDDTVVYHHPPSPSIDPGEEELLSGANSNRANGDAVELLVLDKHQQLQHVVFSAVAPGALNGVLASDQSTALPVGTYLRGYEANWAPNAHGFQLEIELPIPSPSSVFGVVFVDRDSSNQSINNWVGNMSPSTMRHLAQQGSSSDTEADNTHGRLFYNSDVAQQRLQPWVTRGTRARLFDRQGRLLADVNALYDKREEDEAFLPSKGGFFNAVLFRLFAYFVSDSAAEDDPVVLIDHLHLPHSFVDELLGSQTQTRRYVTSENDSVLGTMLAVGGERPNGFFLFESNEDLAMAYSGSTVARLFSLLTLVSLLAVLILLVYATVLSMRIRHLSRQAQRAVAYDGRVQEHLQGSEASDEIGELSRNLSALLSRSARYTHYLEALSGRLSHELRTPLSVVRTSIENIDKQELDAQTATLLERASGGADQLSAIIKALVESTRLEQTVQHAQMLELDLTQWLHGIKQRYQQVYPDTSFTLTDFKVLPNLLSGASATKVSALPSVMVTVSPELLVQAFDKLVDNAVSFSVDQHIFLSLSSEQIAGNSTVTLCVANRGKPMREEHLAHSFDPMFSERENTDGQLHMGLGLYIVRMIADAHQGRAFARNVDSGVLVGMQFKQRN